jgi:hypothetical protein
MGIGVFLVHEADTSPTFSAEVKNALNYIPTPLYCLIVWCLIKHCILPLRVYDCIGILSVRILDPGSYAGVSTENEAAGTWNLMRKVQPKVHADKVPGKVTESDVVMNSMPGYGHRRHTAMSEFFVEIHVIN